MEPFEPNNAPASGESAGQGAPNPTAASNGSPPPPTHLGGLVPFGCGSAIALCLLANALIPEMPLYRLVGSYAQYVIFFLAGSLVAQIGVTALWCALGLGSFRWRFLVTSLLAMLIACSFLFGLGAPDSDNIPFSAALFLLTIGLVGFLLAVGAFAVLSRLTGERLGLRDQPPARANETAQNYSIGYLIGFTTLVAIIVAVLQAVLPSAAEDRGPPAGLLLLLCVLVTLHTGLSIGIVINCAWLVLRVEGKAAGYLGLMLCFLIGIPLDLGLMQFFSGFEVRFEDALPWLLLYALGLACTSILFLLLVRSCGLRLARWAAAGPAEPGTAD